MEGKKGLFDEDDEESTKDVLSSLEKSSLEKDIEEINTGEAPDSTERRGRIRLQDELPKIKYNPRYVKLVSEWQFSDLERKLTEIKVVKYYLPLSSRIPKKAYDDFLEKFKTKNLTAEACHQFVKEYKGKVKSLYLEELAEMLKTHKINSNFYFIREGEIYVLNRAEFKRDLESTFKREKIYPNVMVKYSLGDQIQYKLKCGPKSYAWQYIPVAIKEKPKSKEPKADIAKKEKKTTPLPVEKNNAPPIQIHGGVIDHILRTLSKQP